MNLYNFVEERNSTRKDCYYYANTSKLAGCSRLVQHAIGFPMDVVKH